MPYTPKLLAATFMGSFDKDPADRFPALLDGRDNTLVTERAIAAAVPEEFVTAWSARPWASCRFCKKASPLGPARVWQRSARRKAAGRTCAAPTGR